jgi:hypothetical protein
MEFGNQGEEGVTYFGRFFFMWRRRLWFYFSRRGVYLVGDQLIVGREMRTRRV